MAKTLGYMGSRYSRQHHAASIRALTEQFHKETGSILEALDEFVEGVKGDIPEILVEALEPTFGKALEYCPQDSGDLRASGYLEAEKYRGGSRAVIGFGKGGQPDYAIYVHELPYAHEAPTRSKFLQAALDEDYFSIVSSIPRLIRERAGT